MMKSGALWAMVPVSSAIIKILGERLKAKGKGNCKWKPFAFGPSPFARI
jgi:hypothetical protein